jgi:hypothetical protein
MWPVMAYFTTFTPHFTPLTGIMSSSSSSDDIEAPMANALFSVVDQTMTMLKAKMEASSSRGLMLHQHSS